MEDASGRMLPGGSSDVNSVRRSRRPSLLPTSDARAGGSSGIGDSGASAFPADNAASPERPASSLSSKSVPRLAGDASGSVAEICGSGAGSSSGSRVDVSASSDEIEGASVSPSSSMDTRFMSVSSVAGSPFPASGSAGAAGAVGCGAGRSGRLLQPVSADEALTGSARLSISALTKSASDGVVDSSGLSAGREM